MGLGLAAVRLATDTPAKAAANRCVALHEFLPRNMTSNRMCQPWPSLPTAHGTRPCPKLLAFPWEPGDKVLGERQGNLLVAAQGLRARPWLDASFHSGPAVSQHPRLQEPFQKRFRDGPKGGWRCFFSGREAPRLRSGDVCHSPDRLLQASSAQPVGQEGRGLR